MVAPAIRPQHVAPAITPELIEKLTAVMATWREISPYNRANDVPPFLAAALNNLETTWRP